MAQQRSQHLLALWHIQVGVVVARHVESLIHGYGGIGGRLKRRCRFGHGWGPNTTDAQYSFDRAGRIQPLAWLAGYTNNGTLS